MKLPKPHHNPIMRSISFLFLVLVFTTYSDALHPNKISNTFGTDDGNQRQQKHSASQEPVPPHESSEHHVAFYMQGVIPHDQGSDGIRRLLGEKEPPEGGPPKQGKKPKSPRRPWWKWKPQSPDSPKSKWKPHIPCLPKWGRKKSPPRDGPPPRYGPWWPPAWPPLVPVRALKTTQQAPKAFS